MSIMLHERTKKLIQELFRGKQCQRCGNPAERFKKGKFYCASCFRGDEAGRTALRHLPESDRN
jgi:hypothetical protein